MGFVKIETKVDLGIITSVNKINKEIISYRVFLENYHQENERADGIPIFSFGYNSYTYLVGSRVVCLIKDSNFTKVFIIGQTYDPAITRGGNAARPGETQLSSGGADRSGIAPLGANDIFHAYTEGSYFKFDSKKLNISIADELVINGNRSFFSLSTDTNNSGFSVKNGTFNISAINGLNVFANDGAVYIKAQRLAFYEGANKEKPNFLISNGLHRQIGSESLQIFGIYSFEAGSSKVKGKNFVVDWNLIQGSYGIRLGTGDFKINLMNVSGAEVSFKIGVGPLYLSQFIFDQSALEVKIGAALPDSLKLGGGTLEIKVGNFPGLQTEFLLEGSNAELKIKGVTGSSSYAYTPSKITIENTGLFGSASFEIGSGKLTLMSASKAMGGKIILDGEVEISGNLKVKGSDGIEATLGDVKAGPTSISLTKHKHATSIPGGPTPPLPG
jgi:hypothetical protein